MPVAVYGTLREGDYNHSKLGEHPKFLTQERVSGFQMYNLRGSFPYITKEEGNVLVEVYEITPEAYQRCSDMERGAGYDIDIVDTSVGKAYIWYMDEAAHQRFQHSYGKTPPKILSGDWFEWLRKYRPERLTA